MTEVLWWFYACGATLTAAVCLVCFTAGYVEHRWNNHLAAVLTVVFWPIALTWIVATADDEEDAT